MRFSEVLRSRAHDPGSGQCRAAELFPTLVKESGSLHLWTPGDLVQEHRLRLLLGVEPSYDTVDAKLLDELVEKAEGATNIRLDVFDFSASCTNMTDVHRFIPGMPNVVQTPVLGVWVNGKLEEVHQGFDARRRALQLVQTGS